MTSSAATTTTRRQRPARIQSSASATACVVLAHAALTCVFGPARPDQLGELGVPHRQHAEQEAAVERVAGPARASRSQVVDAAVDLGQRDASVPVGSRTSARSASSAASCSRRMRRSRSASTSSAKSSSPGKAEAKITPVSSRSVVGQRPAVGQLGAARRRLVVLDERDAGVAQRVDAGGDGQLGLAPERGEPVGVDAELLAEVERAGARRQLDHVGGAVDRLEARAAVLALDEPRDVLVERSRGACRVGITSMTCSPCSRRARLPSSNTLGARAARARRR